MAGVAGGDEASSDSCRWAHLRATDHAGVADPAPHLPRHRPPPAPTPPYPQPPHQVCHGQPLWNAVMLSGGSIECQPAP